MLYIILIMLVATSTFNLLISLDYMRKNDMKFIDLLFDDEVNEAGE